MERKEHNQLKAIFDKQDDMMDEVDSSPKLTQKYDMMMHEEDPIGRSGSPPLSTFGMGGYASLTKQECAGSVTATGHAADKLADGVADGVTIGLAAVVVGTTGYACYECLKFLKNLRGSNGRPAMLNSDGKSTTESQTKYSGFEELKESPT